MVALVQAAQLEPITRETVLGLLNRMAPSRTEQGVRYMAAWCRQNMRLINEPFEILQPPAWLLEEIASGRRPWGDCDDMTMLLSSLTVGAGLHTQIVAIRPPDDPEFRHVFPEVWLDGFWIPMDATSRRYPPADWERLAVEC